MKKRLTIELEDKLLQQLKKQAKDNDVTVTAHLREIILIVLMGDDKGQLKKSASAFISSIKKNKYFWIALRTSFSSALTCEDQQEDASTGSISAKDKALMNKYNISSADVDKYSHLA